MANGLLVSNRGVATVQGAWLERDRAGLLTVGARLLGGQALSLLLKQGIQGALGQAARRGTGEFFQGSEAHCKSRARIAEGAPRNDFAPLGGDFTDLSELIRS
jgi:hypothetical protein